MVIDCAEFCHPYLTLFLFLFKLFLLCPLFGVGVKGGSTLYGCRLCPVSFVSKPENSRQIDQPNGATRPLSRALEVKQHMPM